MTRRGPVAFLGALAVLAALPAAAAAPASGRSERKAATAAPAAQSAAPSAVPAPETGRESIEAGISRAVELRVAKRFDEALAQLDATAARIPRLPAGDQEIVDARADIGYQRGLVLEEAGRLPEAEDAYKSVVRDQPYAGAAGHARLSLAAVLMREGKTQEAAETFRSVLRENPRLASDALLGLAGLEESRGNLLEAATAYRNIVRNFPSGAETPTARKALEGICGRILESKTGSTRTEDTIGRGDCLMDANRAPEAEALYNNALKRKMPVEDRVALLMALGGSLDAQEHTSASERVYRKLVRLVPHTPEAAFAQMTIVQGFLDRGKLSDAARELDRIVKEYPGTPVQAQAQFEAGSVYEAMRDVKKAEEAYRKTVELAPQSPWGVEAQQCLIRLAERKP